MFADALIEVKKAIISLNNSLFFLKDATKNMRNNVNANVGLAQARSNEYEVTKKSGAIKDVSST
ncbi:hypothetical protein [Bartonella sp. B30(2025)]